MTRELYPNGRVIDLTAKLDNTIQVYPGDPPFKKSWHVDCDRAGFNVSKLEMGAHVGTHVDAPLHFLKDGADVASMPLERFLGPAVAVDVPKKPGADISPEDFADADIREGDIVLFRTGWEDLANSPRFYEGEWPGITSEAVDALIELKVAAIGGDIASVDSPKALAEGAPAHNKALRAGIPLFEALVNMREVVGKRFFFIGLPLKIEGGEGSPIRAIAILDGGRE